MSSIRTSAKAIIVQGDCLLLVRYRDENGDWYILPGGGQKHGEPLAEALQRECQEEIGTTVQMGELKFSSWAIHMIMLILFSSSAGLVMREWHGCRRKTLMMIGSAILVLVVAVLVLSYGNYLGVTSK